MSLHLLGIKCIKVNRRQHKRRETALNHKIVYCFARVREQDVRTDCRKQLRKLLGQYDKLDAAEDLVRARIDKEIEKNGPKSRKLKKFDKDLDKLAKQREKLREQEQELRDLVLLTPEAESAGDDSK